MTSHSTDTFIAPSHPGPNLVRPEHSNQIVGWPFSVSNIARIPVVHIEGLIALIEIALEGREDAARLQLRCVHIEHGLTGTSKYK